MYLVIIRVDENMNITNKNLVDLCYLSEFLQGFHLQIPNFS